MSVSLLCAVLCYAAVALILCWTLTAPAAAVAPAQERGLPGLPRRSAARETRIEPKDAAGETMDKTLSEAVQ